MSVFSAAAHLGHGQWLAECQLPMLLSGPPSLAVHSTSQNDSALARKRHNMHDWTAQESLSHNPNHAESWGKKGCGTFVRRRTTGTSAPANSNQNLLWCSSDRNAEGSRLPEPQCLVYADLLRCLHQPSSAPIQTVKLTLAPRGQHQSGIARTVQPILSAIIIATVGQWCELTTIPAKASH